MAPLDKKKRQRFAPTPEAVLRRQIDQLARHLHARQNHPDYTDYVDFHQRKKKDSVEGKEFVGSFKMHPDVHPNRWVYRFAKRQPRDLGVLFMAVTDGLQYTYDCLVEAAHLRNLMPGYQYAHAGIGYYNGDADRPVVFGPNVFDPVEAEDWRHLDGMLKYSAAYQMFHVSAQGVRIRLFRPTPKGQADGVVTEASWNSTSKQGNYKRMAAVMRVELWSTGHFHLMPMSVTTVPKLDKVKGKPVFDGEWSIVGTSLYITIRR